MSQAPPGHRGEDLRGAVRVVEAVGFGCGGGGGRLECLVSGRRA